jgi:catechol 2,3-dioxygenase-like lactoylglutathione lyase family enzyme
VIAIRRLDHVCLRVADVDEAAARWGIQFGLTLSERTAERAYLRCGYEPYCLELVQGEPGHDHAGYELRRSVSLDAAAAHLAAAGPPDDVPGRQVAAGDRWIRA